MHLVNHMKGLTELVFGLPINPLTYSGLWVRGLETSRHI